MRIGMMLTLVAAIAMMPGLLRWPGIHWVLAEAYAQGEPAERSARAAGWAMSLSLLPLWMVVFGSGLLRVSRLRSGGG